MSDVARQFSGLPMGLLICQPILEVARGQSALCEVYLQYLFRLAYKKDGGPDDGKDHGTRMISFELERPVTDGKGNISKKTFTVNAPILSLVPIPAFTMDEASVSFSMEVKENVVEVQSDDEKLQTVTGLNYWGFSTSITGEVSTHRENTRGTDKTAKYEIHAHASQQPPAEGMAKLTTILASVIEPIPV